MIEEPQTDSRMVPASQMLFQIIMDGEIVHDGDQTARRHIRSVQAKETERGWRISKMAGGKKRIDYAITTAIAARRCLLWKEAVEEAPSIW